MLTNTPDSSLIQEIIHQQWPQESCEEAVSEDFNWEILDENNDHAVHRHWFKQNYIHQLPRAGSMIIYH